MPRLVMPRFIRLFFAFSLLGCAANAQSTLACNTLSVPPIVRWEGITERTGDIVLNCSGGSPGALTTLNLSIFLTVNITNRVSGITVTDVVFTVDNGSGPQ